jgi:hypothetical protein
MLIDSLGVNGALGVVLAIALVNVLLVVVLFGFMRRQAKAESGG